MEVNDAKAHVFRLADAADGAGHGLGGAGVRTSAPAGTDRSPADRSTQTYRSAQSDDGTNDRADDCTNQGARFPHAVCRGLSVQL